MPYIRSIAYFIASLLLVIQVIVIVIVFGCISMYGSNSPLSFLVLTRGTYALLVIDSISRWCPHTGAVPSTTACKPSTCAR